MTEPTPDYSPNLADDIKRAMERQGNTSTMVDPTTVRIDAGGVKHLATVRRED